MNYLRKGFLCFLIVTFVVANFPSIGWSQAFNISNLPAPGAILATSSAVVPPLLKGLLVHLDNPFQLDFILNGGDGRIESSVVKPEANKLIKYFLAAMTVPQEDLWVNLSPYEKDRIISDSLGKTDMGRDLLAQDYLLKQLAASLIHPEKKLGKTFWDHIYKEMTSRYGGTDFPIDVFQKVWIVPDTATIFEQGDSVYVVDGRLKVMTDADYQAASHQRESKEARAIVADQGSDLALVRAKAMREVIIPAIEEEVNHGKNFCTLRQIYFSLILAKWYKQKMKEAILGREYANKNKIRGIEGDDDPLMAQRIYDRYISAYKKGVFNFIKEDYDPVSEQAIPRKYFSGGFQDQEITFNRVPNPFLSSANPSGDNFFVSVRLDAAQVSGDGAMRFVSPSTDRNVAEVGGKGASLGEMANIDGIATLEHFTVNVNAFREFLKQSGIDKNISRLEELSEDWILLEIAKNDRNLSLNISQQSKLEQQIQNLSEEIFNKIRSTEIPEDIKAAILGEYRQLIARTGVPDLRVAVRSSATAEDLPEASFAGMQDTKLNVIGEENVLKAVRDVWASFIGSYEVGKDGGKSFSFKSVFYRNQQRALKLLSEKFGKIDNLNYDNRKDISGVQNFSEVDAKSLLNSNSVFRHSKVYIAAVVQRMGNPEVAGVAFTVDTKTGAPLVRIEANYGLGETVVGGEASVDGWKILGNGIILDRRLGEKKIAIIPLPGGGIVESEVSLERQKSYCLSDELVAEVARQAKIIEAYYRKTHENNTLFMDLEFLVEAGGRIVFVQARPETLWSNRVSKDGKIRVTSRVFNREAEQKAIEENRVIFHRSEGFGAAPGVAVGKLIVAETLEEAKARFALEDSKGAILVAHKTSPEWVPVAMNKAGGLVTDIGGATNHAAVVGRELGKPVIVNTINALETLKAYDGQEVSLNASNATIYLGRLPIEEKTETIDVVKGEKFDSQRVDMKYLRTIESDGVQQVLKMKPRHPVRSFQRALYVNAFELIRKRLGWDYQLVDTNDDRVSALRVFFVNVSNDKEETYKAIFDFINNNEEKILASDQSIPELMALVPVEFRDFVADMWGGKYTYINMPHSQVTKLTADMKSWSVDKIEEFNRLHKKSVDDFMAQSIALNQASDQEFLPTLIEWMDSYVQMVYYFHLRWSISTAIANVLDEKLKAVGLPSSQRVNLFTLVQAEGTLESTRWIEETSRLATAVQKTGISISEQSKLMEDIRNYARVYRLVDIDDLSADPPVNIAIHALKKAIKGVMPGKPSGGNLWYSFPEEILLDTEFWRIIAANEIAGRIKDDAHHLQPRGQFLARDRLIELGEKFRGKGLIGEARDIFDLKPGDILEAAARIPEYQGFGYTPVSATASHLDRKEAIRKVIEYAVELDQLFQESQREAEMKNADRLQLSAKESWDRRIRRANEIWKALKMSKEILKENTILADWIEDLRLKARRLAKEIYYQPKGDGRMFVVPFDLINKFLEPTEDGKGTIFRHQMPLHAFPYLTDGISLSEAQNPANSRQKLHDHPEQEKTMFLTDGVEIVQLGMDGREVSQKVGFGDMVVIPQNVIHTISNPLNTPSTDFTLKDPLLQLQKGLTGGGTGSIVVNKPQREPMRNGGGEILTQYYQGQLLHLDTDKNGNVVLNARRIPSASGSVDLKIRIVSLNPGAESDVLTLSPFYSDVQMIRIFPWPRDISSNWEPSDGAKELKGTVELLDEKNSRIDQPQAFQGGDLILVRNLKDQKMVRGVKVHNSSSRTLVFAVIDDAVQKNGASISREADSGMGSDVGGIDLRGGNINSEGMTEAFDSSRSLTFVKGVGIEGLSPVIIKIEPVAQLQTYFGKG